MNSLDALGVDLRRRFTAPVKSVTFYLHLIAAIVVGGGFEIWYQVVFKGVICDKWSCEAISSALFAYFPAIVSVALIDFVHERQPYLRSFGLVSAVGFFVLLLLVLATSPGWQLGLSICGAIFAVFFWWAASGDKDCFRDIDPSAATPGPNVPMEGGDKANWKT